MNNSMEKLIYILEKRILEEERCANNNYTLSTLHEVLEIIYAILRDTEKKKEAIKYDLKLLTNAHKVSYDEIEEVLKEMKK